MFEDSLMESQHRLASTSQRWTTVASLTLQCALAAIVIALPMLHPEALPFRTGAPSVMLPLKPVPPPVARVAAQTPASSAATAAAPSAGHPLTLMRFAPLGQVETEAPPATNFAGKMESSGMPDGMAVGSIGTGTFVALAPAVPKGPLHISTGVSTGLLLEPIRPVYPRIAVAAHVEGVVKVEAIISKSGRIESAHATSGPEILRSAALDAIRNAHYSPYMLNGSPTEVETTITVTFKLAG